MTGTVTSFTTLNTDMPTGTVGGVSAADIQNFLASVLGVVPAVGKTSGYTATENDVHIRCDATAGAVAITLPSGASTRNGKFYIVQKIDSSGNAVSVARAGSDTINGATSKSTTTQYQSILVYCTGTTAWYANLLAAI